MPTARISSHLNDQPHFLTPTIANWYYIFDRHDRWQILADSLVHCREHKGLKVHAYVFMLNHLHLIVSAPDVAGFLCDFKKHTSKQLKRSLETHEPDALRLFMDDDRNYCFWKSDNQPKPIEGEAFYLQKLNYIHMNPVKKGYVERPEHWKWSSANPNSPIPVELLV